MGFLDKLWDETVAGPMPETGLGKLRKYDSFSSVRSSPVEVPVVSRSITILRTSSDFRYDSSGSGSDPNSPSGCSTPGSPFSRTPREGFRRMARKKGEPFERAEPRSPTVYDWIVISALDR